MAHGHLDCILLYRMRAGGANGQVKWTMCIIPLGTILRSALSDEAGSTARERGRLAPANLLQNAAQLSSAQHHSHLFTCHCQREYFG